MSIPFALGNSLIRAAVSLGFLGCLMAAGTISSQVATAESAVVRSKAVMGAGVAMPGVCGQYVNPNNSSELTLSGQLETGFLDEFGIAFEDDDSNWMLRVETQQRAFGIDRAVIGVRAASKGTHTTRPSISPPLLV